MQCKFVHHGVAKYFTQIVKTLANPTKSLVQKQDWETSIFHNNATAAATNTDKLSLICAKNLKT